MKCLGNSTELCGGSNRLSLYTHVSAAKPAAKFAFAANQVPASSSSPESSSGIQSSATTGATAQSASTVSSTTSTPSSTESSTKPSSTKFTSTTSTSSSYLSMKTSTLVSSVRTSETASQTSQTSTKTTLVPTPSQTVGSYEYLGCANQTSPLALTGMSRTSADSMTNELCQAFCLKNNYGLAATQDGTTCYCGNGLQSYAALGQQSCKTPCSGNSSEICGGNDGSGNRYLSVWNSTSTTIPATTVKQVGYYVSQGCYSSIKANTPILTGSTYTSTTDMSVESCVGYCITKGYSIAGVQSGTCYCDSALAKTAKNEAPNACNVPCGGNTREFCGASDKWNVYKYDLTSVDSQGVPNAMNLANPATAVANSTAAA